MRVLRCNYDQHRSRLLVVTSAIRRHVTRLYTYGFVRPAKIQQQLWHLSSSQTYHPIVVVINSQQWTFLFKWIAPVHSVWFKLMMSTTKIQSSKRFSFVSLLWLAVDRQIDQLLLLIVFYSFQLLLLYRVHLRIARGVSNNLAFLKNNKFPP